jgi:fermentation-respiration switch protein FrsA (DUF1100 family)
MQKIIIVLLPLIFAYLTVVIGFYADQRNLVFVPTRLSQKTPKDYGLTDYENVKFKNPEGQTLDAWWVRHTDGQPHPVLLYCHGNGDDLSMLSEVSKLFYDYGVDALMFDYRAYGNSEGTPQDLSEKALDEDAQSAYAWLLKEKQVDEKNLIVWGHSLGSSVAAQLATHDHPAGLILEGAFPSVYRVGRSRYPWLLLLPFMVNDKFPTIQYVAQRTCPLLEIHGDIDHIIPIGLGQEVFDAAVQPKQWIAVPGMNHINFPSLAMQYKEPVMAFIQKCTGTTQPVTTPTETTTPEATPAP